MRYKLRDIEGNKFCEEKLITGTRVVVGTKPLNSESLVEADSHSSYRYTSSF
jgi:hypothetical protein